ncbi:MAG: di-heme enzyme [Leptospiraceae bacterium]|nr:di-heme enzyme [Leptospiraceae bacterium]
MRSRIKFPLPNGIVLSILLCTAVFFGSCKEETTNDDALLLALAASGGCAPYEWGLPSNVPDPVVPSDNCQTEARVELGRHLFYDKALSRDESMSCASCHFQSRAFADGKERPRGIVHAGHPTGELHARNAQHLTNVAYNSKLTWNNPLLASLEGQARVPLFSESGPNSIVELGLQNTDYLSTIQADETYRNLFEQAYDGNITEQNVRFALAAFQRSMMSFDSSWDKFTRGAGSATPAQVRGFELFNGEVAECFHCHGGFNFSDSSLHSNSGALEFAYHNNGAYSDSEYDSKATVGLEEITGLGSDRGKFRAPSLRNLGLTMPYFHDGSVNCASPPSDPTNQSAMEACAREALREIVDMYRAGGDALKRGQTVGSSVDTTLIRPFTISDSDRDDIVEFLLALTQWDFATDSRFSNPRQANPRFGP